MRINNNMSSIPRTPLINTFLDRNSKLNLSAIRDADGVYVKHILDSLELTKIIDFSDYQSVCDVGTGWGFPVLALAQYCKDNQHHTQFVWLDARRKKVQAIAQMSQELGLDNITTVWTRVEEHTTTYDIVTARAVAYADVIIPRCIPLCKKWGLICLYKEYKSAEHDEILVQCKRHHLILEQIHEYRLFEWDIQRVLYVLKR